MHRWPHSPEPIEGDWNANGATNVGPKTERASIESHERTFAPRATTRGEASVERVHRASHKYDCAFRIASDSAEPMFARTAHHQL